MAEEAPLHPDHETRSLVERAASADQDAWEALYRRSYAPLFSYARRRLSSDSAADDAVSETMVRAIDRIGSFTWRGAGFDAWLYGILRNVVLEAFRTAGRSYPMILVDQADQLAPGPLDLVVLADQRDEVKRAFEQLSVHDREVLELRVVAGLSAEGVAEVVGRTPGAVRMAQSRALRRLRDQYRAVSDAD